MQFISTVCFIFGLLSLSFSFLLLWDRNNPNRLAFDSYNEIVSTSEKAIPVRIIIREAHIDLPIVPSKIQNGVWETTKNGISYLTSSPLPGEKGNSILYGHNWINILGNLHKVKPGQKIEIYYKNSVRKEFIVSAKGTVTPDQVNVLSQSSDHRITLYTCTGFLDTKRLVITAISKEKDIPDTQVSDNINLL